MLYYTCSTHMYTHSTIYNFHAFKIFFEKLSYTTKMDPFWLCDITQYIHDEAEDGQYWPINIFNSIAYYIQQNQAAALPTIDSNT
jgi:hypothetical protein